MTEYILAQQPDRETEQRRLSLLQSYQDAPTIRSLEAAGVRAGWRCLDAGAGAGSVSRWLARRVGLTGSVLAVDLDTSLLEEQENLQVQRLDLRTDPLPEAAFDLVHTRLVLTHLAEREDVLAKLVRATRPGGQVVVCDIDARTWGVGRDDEVCDRVAQSYSAVSRKAGGDPAIGPALREMLERHGLEDVQGEVFQTYQRGGGQAAAILGLTFQRIADRVPEHGVSQADLDHFFAMLKDPAVRVQSPTMYLMRGTKP